MSRVDILEEKRRDFFLYVDEFQNFATDTFSQILSEARKYRLNLNVTNQYIAQLPEQIRDSVFGNIGTLVSFRIGAQDAEYVAKEYAPALFSSTIKTREIVADTLENREDAKQKDAEKNQKQHTDVKFTIPGCEPQKPKHRFDHSDPGGISQERRHVVVL